MIFKYSYVVIHSALFICSFAQKENPTELEKHNVMHHDYDKRQSYVRRIPKQVSAHHIKHSDSDPEVEWDGWVYDAFVSTVNLLQFSPEHANKACYLQSVKYSRSLANHTLLAVRSRPKY